VTVTNDNLSLENQLFGAISSDSELLDTGDLGNNVLLFVNLGLFHGEHVEHAIGSKVLDFSGAVFTLLQGERSSNVGGARNMLGHSRGHKFEI
jgi:hypothetical protein